MYMHMHACRLEAISREPFPGRRAALEELMVCMPMPMPMPMLMPMRMRMHVHMHVL